MISQLWCTRTEAEQQIMFQVFEDDEDPGMEVTSFFCSALFAELVVPTLITQLAVCREVHLLTRDHLNLKSYSKNVCVCGGAVTEMREIMECLKASEPLWPHLRQVATCQGGIVEQSPAVKKL